MTEKYRVSDQADASGFIILEYLQAPFKGVKFTFADVQFADVENEDGSINLGFSYNIHSDHTFSEESSKMFEQCLGDLLLELLEEMVKKGDAVYYSTGE